MRSERTRECIKKRNLYIVISWVLCFGITLGLIIYGFATKWTGSSSETAKHIKAILITWVLAILPLTLISFLVKDKIKPTVRMINVILAAYLVANWFMYIVGVLMLIDTYFISGKIKKYKTAVITNKEMDLREPNDEPELIRKED